MHPPPRSQLIRLRQEVRPVREARDAGDGEGRQDGARLLQHAGHAAVVDGGAGLEGREDRPAPDPRVREREHHGRHRLDPEVPGEHGPLEDGELGALEDAEGGHGVDECLRFGGGGRVNWSIIGYVM